MFKKGRQITVSMAGLLLLIAGISITIIFLRDKLIKTIDKDAGEGETQIKKELLDQVFKSKSGQFITWGLVGATIATFIVFVSYIARFPKYLLVGTLMALALLAVALVLAYFANEIRKTLNQAKEKAKEAQLGDIYGDFEKAFKGTLYTTIGLAGLLGLFLLIDQNF